jgi:DNA-3-methyladenine glycosylase II
MTISLHPGSDAPALSAEAHLCAVDPRLAGLIVEIGPCPLGTSRREPFDALVMAIVSQQVSTKAAAAIAARLQRHVGAARPVRPDQLIPHSAESLRTAGLSGAKARAVLNLANAVERGEIDLDVLAAQPDDAVIEGLVVLPGIGRWTAEMFLIFSLGRPDVLSLTDSGLRRAARLLYGIPDRDEAGFRRLAEPWRPFRSAASWYLWRYLDRVS